MKRTVCMLLVITLLALPAAQAIQIKNTDTSWGGGVHTDGINNDPAAQAEMLKELGLFLGTDKGFELDRKMTRAEAAVMLVRFLGAEKKVLGGSWKHPFNDVPKWADKYIGWLYQSGLTKGISRTKYGPSQYVTLDQYAIFLCRAVNGNDSWESYGIASADEALLSKMNNLFTRSAAVGLSTRALSLTYTRNGNWTYTVAQYLVNHGVFTAGQFTQAAWGIIPPQYSYLDNEDHIYCTVAGVTLSKTDVAMLDWKTGENSALPYFFASKEQDGKTLLYRIDCKTMACTKISSIDVPTEKEWINKNAYKGWIYTYVSSFEGEDYLFEYNNSTGTANLISVKDNTRTAVLSDLKLYANGSSPCLGSSYFVSGDTILIAAADRLYLADKNGIHDFGIETGTQVLGFSGKSIVTQLVTKENTTIQCLNAADGNVLDTYSVQQDMTGANDPARTVSFVRDNLYYGEAGMYTLDNETGRLTQKTARPVLDVTGFRNDFRPIILTHDLGKRIWGMNGFGGDQIILLEDDGMEHVLLGGKPAHGISIAGFINEGLGDSVAFYSASDVGMQHFNEYHYVALPSYDAASGGYDGGQPEIYVTGYTAGRPELEDKDYETKYVQKEQQRLDALGY